jgi:hypothetical protein
VRVRQRKTGVAGGRALEAQRTEAATSQVLCLAERLLQFSRRNITASANVWHATACAMLAAEVGANCKPTEAMMDDLSAGLSFRHVQDNHYSELRSAVHESLVQYGIRVPTASNAEPALDSGEPAERAWTCSDRPGSLRSPAQAHMSPGSSLSAPARQPSAVNVSEVDLPRACYQPVWQQEQDTAARGDKRRASGTGQDCSKRRKACGAPSGASQIRRSCVLVLNQVNAMLDVDECLAM